MIDHGYAVKLGPLDKGVVERIRHWRNDYSIWRWCRQNDVISDAEQAAWFERQAKDSTVKMYTVWANDEVVGICGLTSIDLWNRRAEFSLYIAPLHQRCGYAKAALQTLLAHAFRTLGLNSVWGETFDDNPARKIFEAVGMHYDGTRPEFYFREGRFTDAHLFSIVAKEWIA